MHYKVRTLLLQLSCAKPSENCTMSCGFAWSNHDGAEQCTTADEKDGCRSERLGEATSVLWQRRRLPRVGQEKLRTTRVGCVSVQSQDVVTAAGVALGVPELDAETSAERDGQLFIVVSALTDGEGYRRCDISSRRSRLSRGGASCTRGGTRTRRDVHELSGERRSRRSLLFRSNSLTDTRCAHRRRVHTSHLISSITTTSEVA